MSVLRSKRNRSKIEFQERAEKIFQNCTKTANEKVPKRYFEYLGRPIVTSASKALFFINNSVYLYGNSPDVRKNKLRYLDRAAKEYINMQKSLTLFFIIQHTEPMKQKMIIDSINAELKMLASMTGTDYMHDFPLRPIHEQENGMQFIENLTKLTKYTYQKISKVSEKYRDILCYRIAEYMNEALYTILTANMYIPACKEEYAIRDQKLRYGLANINAMQKFLYSLIQVVNFTDEEIDTWCGMINTEKKLLIGVIAANKRDFADLPTYEQVMSDENMAKLVADIQRNAIANQMAIIVLHKQGHLKSEKQTRSAVMQEIIDKYNNKTITQEQGKLIQENAELIEQIVMKKMKESEEIAKKSEEEKKSEEAENKNENVEASKEDTSDSSNVSGGSNGESKDKPESKNSKDVKTEAVYKDDDAPPFDTSVSNPPNKNKDGNKNVVYWSTMKK